MSEIEQELVEAADFKPLRVGTDRQDYLAALARACYKLDDDTFDEISEPAANWVNKAVEALNNKEELPEFPDFVEPDEEAEDEEAAEAEADASEDDEPDEKPKVKTPKYQPKPDFAPEKVIKPKRKTRPSKEELKNIKTRYDDLTGEKDRYGIIMGTKTHEAVQMYERGTTSVELKEKLGGRYYNILSKLTKDGHRVERSGVGTFKLTHQEDIVAKSKKGKK